jgi:WD40 repeat protein
MQIETYFELHGFRSISLQDKCKSALTFPGVKDLVRNPFVLHLFSTAVADMDPSLFPTLTRYSIFRDFTVQWFNREICNLPSADRVTLGLDDVHGVGDAQREKACELRGYLDLLSALMAGELLRSGRCDIVVAGPQWDAVECVAEGWIVEPIELEGKKKRLTKTAIRMTTQAPETAISRRGSACPLVHANDSVQFLHKSLWEFFCARLILLASGLDSEASLEVRVERTIQSLTTPRGCISSSEPEVLLFLADWWHEARPLDVDVARVRECLFQVVAKSSSEGPGGVTSGGAAANAVSILNWMGEPILRQPWDSVQLQGADLTGAILCGTSLANANLTGCRLEHAVLRNVDLRGAILTDVTFGEPPPVWLPDGCRSIAVFESAPQFVAVPADDQVFVWDVFHSTSKLSAVLCPGARVSSVTVGLVPLWDTEFLACGCEDGSLFLYELENREEARHVVWSSATGAPLSVPPPSRPVLKRHESFATTAISLLCSSRASKGHCFLAGYAACTGVLVWDFGLAWSQPNCTPHRLEPAPSKGVNCLAFWAIPVEGELTRALVVGCGRQVELFVPDPGPASVWKQYAVLRWSQVVTAVYGREAAGSEASSVLVVGGSRGGVLLWDFERSTKVPLVGCINRVVGVAMSADSNLVAACTQQGSIFVWERLSAQLACEPMQNGARYTSLWFCSVPVASSSSLFSQTGPRQGQHLVVSGDIRLPGVPLKRAMWVWELETRRYMRDPSLGIVSQRMPTAGVAYGPWLPDMHGPLLCTITGTHGIRLWDSGSGRSFGPALQGYQADRSAMHEPTCICVVTHALSAQPCLQVVIVAGCSDGLLLWTLEPRASFPLDSHVGPVVCVAATELKSNSAINLLVASAGPEPGVYLQAVPASKYNPTLEPSCRIPPVCKLRERGMGKSTCLAFGPPGTTPRLLASGGVDGFVRLWDLSSWGCSSTNVRPESVPALKPLGGHRDSISAISFGSVVRDGLLLASSGLDGLVLLHLIQCDKLGAITSVLLASLGGFSESVFSCAISEVPVCSTPRTCYIAAGLHDGVICVWDLDTQRLEVSGTSPVVVCGHRRAVSALQFSGDNLASSGWDSTVRVWRPPGVPFPAWSMVWMSRGIFQALDTTDAMLDPMEDLLLSKMFTAPSLSSLPAPSGGSFSDYAILLDKTSVREDRVVAVKRRILGLDPSIIDGVLVRTEVSTCALHADHILYG